MAVIRGKDGFKSVAMGKVWFIRIAKTILDNLWKKLTLCHLCVFVPGHVVVAWKL